MSNGTVDVEKSQKFNLKLKPRIKKLWLKWLRSRRYRQQHGQLCGDNVNGSPARCCLGILCDVYGREHDIPGQSWWKKDYDYSYNPIFKPCPGKDTNNFDDPQTYVLPQGVAHWAGLKGRGFQNPRIPIKVARKHCEPVMNTMSYDTADKVFNKIGIRSIEIADLNDAGVPFHILADIIEEVL